MVILCTVVIQAKDDWVLTNDLHRHRFFVKSIAPLSVSPSDAVSSFILSLQHSLGLPLFLFP